MREISTNTIIKAVRDLCIQANVNLNEDLTTALENSLRRENSLWGRLVLEDLLENVKIARETKLPLCQDTGMVVVFVDIGQEVRIVGGALIEAVNEGVRRGCEEGFLRASVVEDPIFERNNTTDNTPAVVHIRIIPGEKMKITLVPKGFGSENMSRLKMLTPAQGVEGIKEFVLETVKVAGPNPCPPLIVGVGVGGTMEKVALLAKEALLRPLGDRHRIKKIAALERELLREINNLGIGPLGLGGKLTALDVHIETYPTHIAGLPVAVNLSCHATRHKSTVL